MLRTSRLGRPRRHAQGRTGPGHDSDVQTQFSKDLSRSLTRRDGRQWPLPGAGPARLIDGRPEEYRRLGFCRCRVFQSRMMRGIRHFY